MSYFQSKPEILILTTDGQDISLNLAISTFRNQITDDHVTVHVASLDDIGKFGSCVYALVIVGHGQPIGLETSEGIVTWSSLYERIEDIQSKMTTIVACYSPSIPEDGVFGFEGQIDAEAGAMISAWLVEQSLNTNHEVDIPIDKVTKAQNAMLHPLESVLYFVHGYFGSTDGWNAMTLELYDRGELANYDYIKYFDYADYWLDMYPSWDIDDVHSYCTVSDLAMGFVFDIINSNFAPGTQIDIVGHSLGGLIARELLRVYRSDLQSNYDVDFGRIITLGTPHEGTNLADGSVPSGLILYLLTLRWSQDWDSFLLHQLSPSSDFIETINENPSSYSSDISWTTISGSDFVLGSTLYIYHGGYNDNIVAEWSAHLPFSDPHYIGWINHGGLLDDPNNAEDDRPFDIVADALGPEIDSDGDGLNDIEERLVYGTDEYDSNSDNDAISDGVEVAWGYNPLSASSPIVASSLIHSASVVGFSVTAYVNHYTAMDYVKFYVRYENSMGQWTGYYYKGTDYTPSSGKYSKYWTVSSAYVRMQLKVKAYNSGGIYLGCDTQYFKLNGGGVPPLE